MAEQREPVKRRVALKIVKLGMDSRQPKSVCSPGLVFTHRIQNSTAALLSHEASRSAVVPRFSLPQSFQNRGVIRRRKAPWTGDATKSGGPAQDKQRNAQRFHEENPHCQDGFLSRARTGPWTGL